MDAVRHRADSFSFTYHTLLIFPPKLHRQVFTDYHGRKTYGSECFLGKPEAMMRVYHSKAEDLAMLASQSEIDEISFHSIDSRLSQMRFSTFALNDTMR